MQPKLVGDPARQHYDLQPVPPQCEPPYAGRARKVASIACGVLPSFAGSRPDTDDDAEPAMDLTYPDPYHVALFLIACVASGQCEGEGMNPTRLAEAYHYASIVEPKAVARSLTMIPVHPDLRAVFYRRFEACRTLVIELVASMTSHWREVFIAPLEAARVRMAALSAGTAAQRLALDALSARVDEVLLATKPDPELREEIATLRRDYARSCMELGYPLSTCLAGTSVARSLTRLLIQLAAYEGDTLTAAAEEAVFRGARLVAGERETLRQAMAASIAREADAERELSDALARGVGADTIAKQRGGEPEISLDIENVVGDWGAQDVDYGGVGGATETADFDRAGLESLEAEVGSVSRRGAVADITFRKEIDEWDEGYGCRNTGRPTYINPETGEISYEEVCAGYTTHSRNVAPERIIVPWAEVQRLKKGMIVQVFLQTKGRKARVVGVRPGTKEPFRHTSYTTGIDELVELRGIAPAAVPERPPAIVAAMHAILRAEIDGDWEAAAHGYRAVLGDQPHPPLYLGLARALEHQGELEAAVDAYQQYLAVDDRSPRGLRAQAAIAELHSRLESKPAAAPPPPPALHWWTLVSRVAAGGGSSVNTGGLATFRWTTGVAFLGQHLEAGAFGEGTGGDVSGYFGVEGRGYVLTGPIRPFVLGALALGKYDANTSRPVRASEVGAGVALMRAFGRRLDLGVSVELTKRWVSIGADPIFGQIEATSDASTQLRVGVEVHFRTDKKQ